METRTTFKEAKESETEKMSTESSIFATILADIEENPTILQNHKNLARKVSIFDELSPTKKKKPSDFTRTVPQTLTRSDLVDKLNQELKILKSEIEFKDQTSDRFVSRECNCVELEERKVEVVKFLEDGDDLESEEIYKDFDEMLSTMLGDDDDEDEEECGEIDEFIDEMLEKVEEDRSYLEKTQRDFVFGGLLETLLKDRLREKAEEQEKEIDSWITNGEPQTVEEERSEIKKSKKKSPVKVKMDRIEQELTVSSKRDYSGFRRRLYLIEKLRERDDNKKKRRVKAVRFGVEFSCLMVEYMFLRPNDVLADDYWLCLKRLGVDKDDQGMSLIIGKLEEVVEMVMRKKENMVHYNVNLLLEPSFWFDDYIRLCADAIQVLGKIVWGLRRDQSEKVNLSDLDSLFEDCGQVLMKLELKLAEMKQRVYRSVSADYESFSKSEKFDIRLRSKFMNRVNADNRLRRSMIGSYLVEIWKSLFQAEALHEQRKEV